MKVIYWIFFLFIQNVITPGNSEKSIIDPVARHDARQCGTYLCNSMPDYATAYLEEGCNGEFSAFLQRYTEDNLKKEVRQPQELKEFRSQHDNMVNLKTMVYLLLFSTLACWVIGYLYGMYEYKNYYERDNFYKSMKQI